MISFCTWIKNRFYQFEQCWSINLELMGKDDEWVILDAGSNDGMEKWTTTDSRVKVVKYSFNYLHFAKLYNLSHSLATKPILVNLDADNYIGPKFCEWAERIVSEGKAGHSWSNKWEDGTYGRITYSRKVFNSIGGYDETLAPVGYQDTDILQRISANGIQVQTTNDQQIYGGSIPNQRKETMRYVNTTKDFHTLNAENHYQSCQNIRKKKTLR